MYQIRCLGARVTALFTDEGIVLVDAGNRPNLTLIAASLKTLGRSLEHIRLIVLTHYHPDHSGGLSNLVKATSAKVAVHRFEANIIAGEKPVPNPFSHSLLATLSQPFLPMLSSDPVNVDYLLDDGVVLPPGEEVRVIHTPGHTPGSICLYVESKKVLIVGDALQYRFRKLTPPAWWVTENYDQAIQSLRKLVPLDFSVICFSHFPSLRVGAKEALMRLIQSMDGGAVKPRSQ